MGFHRGPKVVTDGLVLYLDAANTKSYPGTGTGWNDLSGNGNNGTLVNGPTFDSANNGSIVFDGANDYVNTGLLFDKEDFTYAAWFNRNGGLGYRSIVNSFDGSSVEWANIGLSNNTLSFAVDNNNIKVDLFGSSIQNNTWYYMVGVWIQNTGSMKVYLNAILDAQATHPNKSTIIAKNPERIGCRADKITEVFDGKITMPKVYNRALTPEEILQNYNSTKSRFNL